MRKRLMVACAVVAVVGGCTLEPKYNRPAAPVPTTLPSGEAYRAASGPATAPASAILWQDFVSDPKLRQVIATALENNRDLRIAALNVERTQALYGIQRAELLPTVNANASMSKARVPGDLNGSGRAMTSRQYQAGLGAAWEIDFFGRIRSLSDAALQEFFASQEARRSAQISLVAGVASAYLNLAADRESLQLAKTTFEAQQGALDLVQHRYDRGIAADIDVERARQQVETARGAIVRYTRRAAEDSNALNLLVGATVPEDLLPADLASYVAPQDIAAGVSSEVLLQRPDVLAAEHRLQGAYANIGAARAAFFPRVTLTGSVGTASSELSGLFGSGSGTWTFSPQIVMPIFDPRVWSAEKVTQADQKIALAQYERTIQASFRDVADALAVYGTIDQEIAAQEAVVNAAGESYRLAGIRYVKGVDSYLSVLDAQRSLYGQQQLLVVLRQAKLANQVALYAALGGGWQNAQDPGRTPTTLPSR